MFKTNERIKYLRTENKLTQVKLAEIIGITPESIQRFEYGTARPKLETLVKIADYFDVSMDYIIRRSDNLKRT